MNKPKSVFVSTQFALFFDEIIDRPDQYISDFNNKFSDTFNQPPLVSPVPKQLVNSPIVQYISKNGLHACSFAQKRADYFHFSSDRNKQFTYEEIKEEFISTSKNFLNFFPANNINRIGFVSKFFLDDARQGQIIANLLNNKFIEVHSGVKRDAKIQYISRMNLIKDFEFNNNTTIEKINNLNFFEDSKPIPKNGILIIRDFNTIPEKIINYKGKFNNEYIIKIIEEGEKEFKLVEIENLLWNQN